MILREKFDLIKYSHPDTDEYILAYVLKDDDKREAALHILHNQDHGGLPFEEYQKILSEGEWKAVDSIEETKDYDGLPYDTGDYHIEAYPEEFFFGLDVRVHRWTPNGEVEE